MIVDAHAWKAYSPTSKSGIYLLVKGLNWEVHGSKLDFEAGGVAA